MTNKKALFSIVTLALFSGLFLNCHLAFAGGNAGDAQPSGGGCFDPETMTYSTYNDTCYGGISWRFYTVDGSHYNKSSDSYTISAGNSGSTTISGCNGTDGYWLLAYERYNTKTSYPYVKSYIGSQRGAVKLSVSAHWANGYARDATISKSGFPTLTANFDASNPSDGAIGTWDMVKGFFEEAKAAAQKSGAKNYGNITSYSWNSSSSLSWFCYAAEMSESSTYYSASNAGSGEVYSGTGIVSTSKTTTAKVSAQVGETVELRFSHNIYSNLSTKNVGWTVESPSLSGATIKSQSVSSHSGTANLTEYETRNSKYAAAGRTLTDGSYYYLARDTYSVSFASAGTYNICESITITGQSFKTTACVEVTVGKDDTVANLCTPSGTYPSGTIYSGTTWTTSFIKSNVFTSWESNTIYAKPGDQISWYHCYYPDAQGVKYSTGSHEEPQTPTWGNLNDSPHLTQTNYIGNQDTFVATSNYFTINTPLASYLQSLPTISISNTGDFSPSSSTGSSVTFTGTIGNQPWTLASSPSRTVKTNAVAQTITQSIDTQTGTNSVSGHNTWTWPYKYNYTCTSCSVCGKTCVTTTDSEGNSSESCSCNTCNDCVASTSGNGTHLNSSTNGYWYDIESTTSAGGTSASVKIPYNYINTISVSIRDDYENVKAGETFHLDSATAYTGTRYNSTTDGDYATKTPTATIKLYAFYSSSNTSGGGVSNSSAHGDCGYYSSLGYSSCTQINSAASTLNNSYLMEGDSQSFFTSNNQYSVFDIPAGYYFCVGASVWPYTTDGNTDMGSPSNSQTYYATPSCRVVAKEPTFQVWGGSIYLNGSANLSTMEKTNLYSNFAAYSNSLYGYKGANTNVSRYYSSWVELMVAKADGIDTPTLASGAASGYTQNNSGNLVSSPGGSSGTNWNNLTLPNVSGGSRPTKTASSSIKANLISSYIDTGTFKTVSGTVDLLSSESYDNSEKTNAKEVRRTKSSGDLVIKATGSLPQKTTHIVYSEGNIEIASDLLYNQETYVSSTQIPQYIIYAEGNINIQCGVDEIDAILISEGTIDTCSNGGGDNDENRSNQLVIKGALIANQLILGRTYGASVGQYSEVPAEIIDADPTTYLWGMSEATETPTLTTTYLHELAPRY